MKEFFFNYGLEPVQKHPLQGKLELVKDLLTKRKDAYLEGSKEG